MWHNQRNARTENTAHRQAMVISALHAGLVYKTRIRLPALAPGARSWQYFPPLQPLWSCRDVARDALHHALQNMLLFGPQPHHGASKYFLRSLGRIDRGTVTTYELHRRYLKEVLGATIASVFTEEGRARKLGLRRHHNHRVRYQGCHIIRQ